MSTTLKVARPACALTFPVPILLHCAMRVIYDAVGHTAATEWNVVGGLCDGCSGPVEASLSFGFGGYGQVRHHRLTVGARCHCGEHLGERSVRITGLVPSDHVPAPNAE